MKPVAIIGGGISGLAAAYYLGRAGFPSTIYELAQRLGGVIDTEKIDGCVVEAGPDSFISQKPAAMDLIRELGIAGDVVGSNDHLRKTYVLRHGRLTPMPDGLYLMVPTELWPLVTTGLVSLATKWRMALELLRPPAPVLEDRSVADFVRAHYGQEAVDYLAEPLLAGIYGGDPQDLSIASVLPRFVELERRYGSLTRGVLQARRAAPPGNAAPLFLTLKSGMRQLIKTLENAIGGRASVVRAKVADIEPKDGSYRLVWEGGAADADRVIVATPAHAAATLLQRLDPELAGHLGGVRYHSSVTVALGYDRSGFGHTLNGFGFLVPRVERRLLTACTWVGTKFPNRVADDRLLLRCFIGAGTNDALLARSDEAIEAGVREELARLMGIRVLPRFCRVQRWRRAMAQYSVGHQARIEAIQARAARLPGLHLAGNAYLGIGISDCIRTAQQAVSRIVGPGAKPPAAPALSLRSET